MKLITECNLSEVVVEVLKGRIIVFPTETSYGLGCDATNQASVDKIFKIKGRRSDKPLLVVVPTVEMARKYLKWNNILEKLSKKYWPGALTVVGDYASTVGEGGLANGVIANDGTVAIRVTAHPLLRSITEKVGRPLVATSANVSDAVEIYDAEEIYSTFEDRHDQPDLILNYGTLPKRPPTTILKVSYDNIEVLRQGEMRVESGI